MSQLPISCAKVKADILSGTRSLTLSVACASARVLKDLPYARLSHRPPAAPPIPPPREVKLELVFQKRNDKTKRENQVVKKFT